MIRACWSISSMPISVVPEIDLKEKRTDAGFDEGPGRSGTRDSVAK